MEPNNQTPIASTPVSAPASMPSSPTVAQTGMPTSIPTSMPSNVPKMPAPTVNSPKKVGPIVAILVIVLILIIAALYLFASRINQQSLPNATTAAETTTNPAPLAVATQPIQPVTNTADDPLSLQADLNASTNGLDSQNF